MGRQFVKIGILLIFLIFLIPGVLAEAWFTLQPNPIYNIGDELEISISVSEGGEQLKVDLSCGNDTKMIFFKYLENETAVNIAQPLTKEFLGDIRGKCRVAVEYGLDGVESTDLTISDKVFLKVEIENQNYNPGEKVHIWGEAEKANTQLLDGFFELEFEGIDFIIVGPIRKGKFESNFTLPEDIIAGPYLINITAYERGDEGVTNTGERKIGMGVRQVPKKIDVALDNQDIKPGNDLNFRILLYDQSEQVMEGEASFLIEDLEGNAFVKDLAKIDESKSFHVSNNFSSGYYKIKAYSSGIYGERQFYVEENEEAEFRIINGTLVVKSIGNVRYDKAIQVKIGDIVEVINDIFEVGEEKKYELVAPIGEYDIIITDGESSLSGEKIGLTGNVVGVKEIRKNFFVRNKSLAWFFLFLVMGMFIFVSARRILKKRFVLSESAKPSIEAGAKGAGVIRVRRGEEKLRVVREPKEAEHSLVLKGHKQDTPLICLKIKNEISKAAEEKIEKTLRAIKEEQGIKAATYKSGGYSLIIFSPLVTKTYKNYSPAVKVALELSRRLKEHNSRTQDKIEFGMSVHSGEIVSSLQDNKLKFTSLGNALSMAKKIADVSEGEVLLSGAIHEKTVGTVKADKIKRYGLEVFTVNRVLDTDRNQVFIQDFLKKMAEGSK